MGLTRIRAEQISDIDYKQAVRVIETTNVTLSGGAPSTVDGVTLVAGDRVLVAGQSTGSENGLYDVSIAGTGSNGTWVRTADGNTTGEINAGMIVMVTEGTSYADTSWKLVTNDPIVIDSTSLLFLQNTGNSFNVIVANSTSIAANGVSSSISFTSGNNLVITGNAAADIINFAVSASPSFSGNVIAGNVSTAGNVQASYVLGNGSQLTGLPAGYANSNAQSYFASGTSSANISITGNLLTTANVSAQGYVLGNGAFLTGLPAGYANSNAAAYFASGTSSSNIAITGNILTTAYISATGNITGNVFVGNGAALTSLTGANVTGIVAQATQANYANTANAVSGSNVSGAVANATVATYANTANAVSGSNVSGQVGNALIAGTVYANAQPNITSVGTLTSLSVSGNIIGGNISVVGVTVDTGNVTAGNILTGGLVSAQGNLTAGNLLVNANATILGNLSVAGTVTFSNSSVIVTNDLYIELANNQSTYTGINGAGLQAGNTGTGTLTNWTYASTPNAWSTNVGISAAGSVFGNTFYGNGAGLTSLVGANVTGTVPAATIAATVTTAAQPNITSVGALTSLSVTGNVSVAGIVSVTSNLGNANIATQIITADASYINTNQPGVMIHVTGQTVNPTRLYIDGAGSNNYAAYIGRHYNGTPTSPSQVLANTVVSRFGANPYGVSGFAPISTTRIDMMTVEDQTSTNQGSQILLAATPLGSNVIANVAVFNGTGLSVVGNVRASTTISAAGNITGSYILGNGAFLSGVITSVANINNGTSNISVYDSGNITVGVSGVGNTVVFTPTQADFNTAISAAGNITGNYIYGNGSQLTGISSTGTVVGGNLLILTRSSGTIDATIVAGYVIVLARSGNIDMPVSS